MWPRFHLEPHNRVLVLGILGIKWSSECQMFTLPTSSVSEVFNVRHTSHFPSPYKSKASPLAPRPHLSTTLQVPHVAFTVCFSHLPRFVKRTYLAASRCLLLLSRSHLIEPTHPPSASTHL
ncbi:hypothetical protein FB107DRAFT_263216 [Schizophyllum commune]